MNRAKSKLTIAALCLLILAGQTPLIFADESTGAAPSDKPTATEQQDSSDQGGSQNETPGTGESGAQTEDQEDPVVVHKLTGKVLEYKYSADKTSAKGTNKKEIKIKVGGNATKTIEPESDGRFSLELADSEVIEAGEYTWTIDSDENYLAASGTLKENEDAKLYVRERYEANSSDYKMADSDNIINKILRMAGKYVIVPSEGKMLSKTLDGLAVKSLTVSVAADGAIESFYVYEDDNCSKVFTADKATIDDGAPEVGTVTVEAADKNTYVKSHGIYGKKKADILIKASVKELGVGLKNVYLVGKNGDKTTTYEATEKKFLRGEYTYSIPLPGEETLLEHEVLYIVATDLFGNKSKETLIAVDENGSTVTLEAIAPTVGISFDKEPNSNAWYNTLPNVVVTAKDDISGLASVSLSEDGKKLTDLTLSNKVNDEKSINATLKVDSPSEDGKYEVQVKAIDNSGNEVTEKRSVRIDLVAPQLSAEGVTEGEHYKNSPSIKIEEDEKYYNAEGASISYSVTRDGKNVFSKTVDKVNKETVPSSIFAADGKYSITVNAEDAAGNKANPISYSFVKDSTAPVVTWSGVQNGKFYNKPQTATLTVKERFFDTNKVDVSATRVLKGANSNLGFPWGNKAETSVSSKKFSEIGTYTLSASATDKAGNASGKKTISFTIDTKAPDISISGVRDGGVYTYGEGVAPHVKVTDDYPDKQSIVYTKAGQVVSKPSFDQQKENDGLYTLTVTATDKAGNTTTKTVTFTINRFGSHFEYGQSVKDVMGKAFLHIDNDLVIKEFNVSK
ncbi:MAG: Ig-like domain-containing protein, partial [Bacillota bacterium]|nr:Ig-like domain-containing protein [Bacillota bacterium]